MHENPYGLPGGLNDPRFNPHYNHQSPLRFNLPGVNGSKDTETMRQFDRAQAEMDEERTRITGENELARDNATESRFSDISRDDYGRRVIAGTPADYGTQDQRTEFKDLNRETIDAAKYLAAMGINTKRDKSIDKKDIPFNNKVQGATQQIMDFDRVIRAIIDPNVEDLDEDLNLTMHDIKPGINGWDLLTFEWSNETKDTILQIASQCRGDKNALADPRNIRVLSNLYSNDKVKLKRRRPKNYFAPHAGYSRIVRPNPYVDISDGVLAEFSNIEAICARNGIIGTASITASISYYAETAGEVCFFIDTAGKLTRIYSSKAGSDMKTHTRCGIYVVTDTPDNSDGPMEYTWLGDPKHNTKIEVTGDLPGIIFGDEITLAAELRFHDEQLSTSSDVIGDMDGMSRRTKLAIRKRMIKDLMSSGNNDGETGGTIRANATIISKDIKTFYQTSRHGDIVEHKSIAMGSTEGKALIRKYNLHGHIRALEQGDDLVISVLGDSVDVDIVNHGAITGKTKDDLIYHTLAGLSVYSSKVAAQRCVNETKGDYNKYIGKIHAEFGKRSSFQQSLDDAKKQTIDASTAAIAVGTTGLIAISVNKFEKLINAKAAGNVTNKLLGGTMIKRPFLRRGVVATGPFSPTIAGAPATIAKIVAGTSASSSATAFAAMKTASITTGQIAVKNGLRSAWAQNALAGGAVAVGGMLLVEFIDIGLRKYSEYLDAKGMPKLKNAITAVDALVDEAVQFVIGAAIKVIKKLPGGAASLDLMSEFKSVVGAGIADMCSNIKMSAGGLFIRRI